MDRILNGPTWIKICLVASFVWKQVARINYIACFFYGIQIVFFNKYMTFPKLFSGQSPLSSLQTQLIHFLLKWSHYPNPKLLLFQATHADLVPDQAYTLLDNCTPTVGFCADCCLMLGGGVSVLRWHWLRRLFSCITWNMATLQSASSSTWMYSQGHVP